MQHTLLKKSKSKSKSRSRSKSRLSRSKKIYMGGNGDTQDTQDWWKKCWKGRCNGNVWTSYGHGYEYEYRKKFAMEDKRHKNLLQTLKNRDANTNDGKTTFYKDQAAQAIYDLKGKLRTKKNKKLLDEYHKELLRMSLS